MPHRTVLAPIRLAFILAALTVSACSNVGVGADNRYGYTRGVATVGVPIDSIADGIQAVVSPKAERIEGPLTAQVASVRDGDTITVLIDGRNETVGLIGVDAPKLDQAPWGRRARDGLALLVDGKTVKLETDVAVRDQDKRLLAYVFVDDIFVNRELLLQGLAVLSTVPPNVAHVEELQQAQEEAKKNGFGVWDPAQPLLPGE